MHDIDSATTAEELTEIKLWLFQENIRLQAEKQSLKVQRETLEEEKSAVKLMIKDEMRKSRIRKEQLDQQEKMVEEKFKILKRGFDELDEDRKTLRRLEQRLLEQRRVHELPKHQETSVDMFFKGVNDTLSLKKRYKDLLKIFHPDNIAGDKETVVSITKEYDSLKEKMQ